MIESDWRDCRAAGRMLIALRAGQETIQTRWQGQVTIPRRRINERKLRLFAWACCRRIKIAQMSHSPLSDLVLRWIDGEISVIELGEGIDRTMGPVVAIPDALGLITEQPSLSLDAIISIPARSIVHWGDLGGYHGGPSDLLREIAGDPFRPAVIEPVVLAWNDGTIPRMAQSIYENRTFDDVPILGDALEESGCADGRIVAHCREPGPHLPGCWVVDLCRGKG